MNEKQGRVLSILVALVLMAGSFWIGSRWNDSDDDIALDSSPLPTATYLAYEQLNTPLATITAKAVRTHAMAFSYEGVTPVSLRASVGDTIIFRNISDAPFWVVGRDSFGSSGCADINSMRPLMRADSYTISFTRPVACTIYNHGGSSEQAREASIIVE